MDPVEIVRRMGGSATYKVLVTYGTRAALRTAVSQGRLRRLARGRYALPALPAPAAAAAVTRGVVSHASAALVHELEVPTAPAEVHITVPPGARPAVGGEVRLHWSRLGPDDASEGVTTVLRTVLDCAVTMPFQDALAVADSALGMKRVTKSELVVAAYAQAPRRRARCVAVADAADGRAENVFESGTRAVLLERGVRGFQARWPVLLPQFTAHVDLADPARRLAVEAEGFEYHSDKVAFARDCERYDELVAADWLVLRFTWSQVRFRPDWVADVVRRTQRLRPPQVRRWSTTLRPRTGVSPGNDEAVPRSGGAPGHR